MERERAVTTKHFRGALFLRLSPKNWNADERERKISFIPVKRCAAERNPLLFHFFGGLCLLAFFHPSPVYTLQHIKRSTWARIKQLIAREICERIKIIRRDTRHTYQCRVHQIWISPLTKSFKTSLTNF